MISEKVHAEPDITKEVHFDQDYTESIVDIYVSAESLRVYENPWMESMSPNIPGLQHAESVVSENSERRNGSRTDSVCQHVAYLLLLAGILALICLGVQMKTDKASWIRERNQLLADNANLSKIRDQLTANNTELSKEIEEWRKLWEQKKEPGLRHKRMKLIKT